MRLWRTSLIFSLVTLLITAGSLEAAFTVRNGKFINAKDLATKPVQEHYSLGMKAYHAKKWKEAVSQLRIVVASFPGTSFAKDAEFYLAESYFHLEDYDFANQHADNYLKQQNNLKHFEQAICLKFVIAERFRHGSCRRILGSEQLPRMLAGWDLALIIYDEVIAALPSHDIAARAMFSKARLLLEMKEYWESIDTLQLLIKQFPKHEFTPESYVRIAKIYAKQCSVEPQNPDILALAEINALKFKQHFPNEERIPQVDECVMVIKEIHARGLYETGQFYERIKKPGASVIFYYSALKQFPDTAIADACKERLRSLKKFSEAFPAEDVL